MAAVDTIAAVATPRGYGGIGIIRVSGPGCREIALSILGSEPIPRHGYYAVFRDEQGDVIDSGVLLHFKGPHSFTGEDTLELQAHGSPFVLEMLTARLFDLGARPARPGEFSERAFRNGKIDLVQAESIQKLIYASSGQAARAAQRSLQGDFSILIRELVDELTELRVFVESSLDFSDEEIEFLEQSRIASKIAVLGDRLMEITQRAQRGRLLVEGFTLAIAGPPNAGKSSLLNRLVQRETAIVSEIPGTTRDVIRDRFLIGGIPVSMVDTAGLRMTEDPVEREGVRRARLEFEQADHILVVFDDAQLESAQDALSVLAPFPTDRTTVVINKIDLSGRDPGLSKVLGREACAISVATGEGIESLLAHLKEVMGGPSECEDAFSANTRHVYAIKTAYVHLKSATEKSGALQAELLAEDLSAAQKSLAEITGDVTSEELLGRIFSAFCIGK